ncbi:SDR family NAD(P)-dependent oxidoreductase [Novosphingobium sp.]|uniref:SDR family NAD(P)-dependent oxidoreductase n=2 Tax=Novosphingobium sp. TaxID=1874826 RepID=UPI002FD9E75A
MLLGGKTVLVTGGGTGIGAAVAQEIVAEGGRVVITGRRQHVLAEVADELGDAARFFVSDAGKREDMERAVAFAAEVFSPIDAVITCAGTMGANGVASESDEEWARILHDNLTTVFVTARAALPTLIDRKGALVVVSSLGGLQAVPQSCGYTAAKHGTLGLVRSMAFDYGPQGVRVNAVCPGFVTTPMADGHMALVMKRENCTLEEAYLHVSTNVPLRRAATPPEVASTCTFLVSDKAAAVTGAILPVDGGATVVSPPMLRVIG